MNVQKNLNIFRKMIVLDEMMDKKFVKEVKIPDNKLEEWYN
jgi:hypothetical protein